MTIPLLRTEDLTKRYGGVVGLAGASISVAAGTVHAVVGENGAGKSTLMRILAGAERPDAGRILLDGRPVRLASPLDARAQGIGIVHQELSLFPDRTVAANLFVGAEPSRRGLVSRNAMREAAAPVLEQVGLRVDLEAKVDELQLGEQQLVEIGRVLLQRPRILILDEPNSALTARETERLFGILRELTRGGLTSIYVSHRLEEVFDISDHVTVIRNGVAVMSAPTATLSVAEVVRAMIGRESFEALVDGDPGDDATGRRPPRAADTASDGRGLRVAGLSSDDLVDVTLEARRGDIVGLAGLEGSGASALLRVLYGLERPSRGEVRMPDGLGLPRTPTEAARRGIAFVPADRRTEGLMLRKSVAHNVAQVAAGALRPTRRVLTPRAITAMAQRQIERLRIVGTPHVPAETLSGGNQQKVVLGKWLETHPGVLLLDDPTRGVDIGAKKEIYRLIRERADEGRIVLVTSTELPELCELADRVLVFHRGRLVGGLGRAEATPRRLLQAINTGRMGDA